MLASSSNSRPQSARSSAPSDGSPGQLARNKWQEAGFLAPDHPGRVDEDAGVLEVPEESASAHEMTVRGDADKRPLSSATDSQRGFTKALRAAGISNYSRFVRSDIRTRNDEILAQVSSEEKRMSGTGTANDPVLLPSLLSETELSSSVSDPEELGVPPPAKLPVSREPFKQCRCKLTTLAAEHSGSRCSLGFVRQDSDEGL